MVSTEVSRESRHLKAFQEGTMRGRILVFKEWTQSLLFLRTDPCWIEESDSIELGLITRIAAVTLTYTMNPTARRILLGTKDFDKHLRADVFAISFPFAHLKNSSITPFPSCFNRSFSVSISRTHSHGGRRLVHQSFEVLSRGSSVSRPMNNSPLGVLPACRPPIPK